MKTFVPRLGLDALSEINIEVGGGLALLLLSESPRVFEPVEPGNVDDVPGPLAVWHSAKIGSWTRSPRSVVVRSADVLPHLPRVLQPIGELLHEERVLALHRRSA